MCVFGGGVLGGSDAHTLGPQHFTHRQVCIAAPPIRWLVLEGGGVGDECVWEEGQGGRERECQGRGGREEREGEREEGVRPPKKVGS